jgi:hypothetical protein
VRSDRLSEVVSAGRARRVDHLPRRTRGPAPESRSVRGPQEERILVGPALSRSPCGRPRSGHVRRPRARSMRE